jgi:hypothetical protein
MVMGLYPPDMAEIKRMMTLINTLVPLQCDVSFFSSGNLVSSTEMETRNEASFYFIHIHSTKELLGEG